MPSETAGFSARIDRARADDNLQQALTKVQHGFINKRKQAFAHGQDFTTLARQAKAAKAKMVSNLAANLARFEQAATDRGARVYRAKDANAANQQLLAICQQHGIGKLVKSKSMVSEEIECNAALAASGIEVVETDLGEYILQLRNEKPSHIIAPALHLTKQQIIADFKQHHKSLDPQRQLSSGADLLHEARTLLRNDFLSADAGLTGANMLVVADGSLVLVTNEGNADLCVQLPRIHIVITSIEKLVADYSDVWLLLRLLARSATGQTMSVYNSIIRANPTDRESGRELHIILLDNGRSNWPGTPLEEMLRCIKCGACMNHCPVYATIGGHAYGSVYPGPIGAILSPGLAAPQAPATKSGFSRKQAAKTSLRQFGELSHASTFCGRCESVCPVQIPITKIMRHWREQAFRLRLNRRRERISVTIWAWIARHSHLYHFGYGVLMRLGNVLAGIPVIKSVLPLCSHAQGNRKFSNRILLAQAWTEHRDFPLPEALRFARNGDRIKSGGSFIATRRSNSA